jgi:transcription elongation GreA/GreB family factor
MRFTSPSCSSLANARVVVSRVGATLLGLAEGDQMKWTTRHGEARSLTILKVEHPEDGQEHCSYR